MKELRVDVLRVVEPLQVLDSIHIFAERQPLLIVYLLVVGSHVLHDGNLRWDLSFCCPPLCEKRPDLRLVQIGIIVSCMLDTVDVEGGRLMKVVVV